MFGKISGKLGLKFKHFKKQTNKQIQTYYMEDDKNGKMLGMSQKSKRDLKLSFYI